MNIVVAVNSDWAIGFGDAQSIIIPEDRRHFKELTEGGVVIMGRTTFYSIGKPLPNRTNIVLTRDLGFSADGAIIAHSRDDVLREIAGIDSDKVFVIGGSSIYNLFLPLCDTAYVTKIYSTPVSDKFFPNLDNLSDWTLKCQSDIKISNGIEYSFNTYRKLCRGRRLRRTVM